MSQFWKTFKQADTISILWMLAMCASFSTSMTMTKFLSNEIAPPMIVLTRLIAGWVVILPLMLKEGWLNLKSTQLPLHFIRVCFMLLAMMCTYYAYTHLELAFAISIGFTGPLITTILAAIILNDKVTKTQFLLIIIGYLGVLVMVRPQNIEYNNAILVALGANFFAGCMALTVKKLTETDSPLQMLAYSYSIAVIILLFAAPFFWKTPCIGDLKILAALGCTGSFSYYCLTKALQRAPASAVAPFEYSKLLIATPIGIFLFEEIPSYYTIAGSIIIIIAGFFLTYTHALQKENG